MTDKELLSLAREASSKAYVPYSKFAVGAALECKGGKVFTGCNVENVPGSPPPEPMSAISEPSFLFVAPLSTSVPPVQSPSGLTVVKYPSLS